jgi:hypothetical protein
MNGTVESISVTITSSQKSDSSSKYQAGIRSFLPKISCSKSQSIKVSPSGIEGAKKAAQEQGKRIDVYALEQEFLESAKKTGFKPDNVDGAFIGFVRKKMTAA